MINLAVVIPLTVLIVSKVGKSFSFIIVVIAPSIAYELVVVPILFL